MNTVAHLLVHALKPKAVVGLEVVIDRVSLLVSVLTPRVDELSMATSLILCRCSIINESTLLLCSSHRCIAIF